MGNFILDILKISGEVEGIDIMFIEVIIVLIEIVIIIVNFFLFLL